MYNRFFGLKERPFKLVPNPAYLFLSRIHEEVLAHLNYAVKYGEGFVEITGEVGTGKTTLCRMFLENLGENTAAAYIFNPKLDALQLLKAINDEFGIPTADTDSLKSLIDRLNAFLLDKMAQGTRVILLIDEAQNLSADVLEQLRLLSNLETTTSKLLQIILVGQPELGAMLESDALRQLNQRITLSCHLIPLTSAETRAYIEHRLHVASQKPVLEFSRAAYRSIFKYTGGVPRLINIACDRALLTAFSLGKTRVTNGIVRRAIRELDSGRRRSRRPRFHREGLIIGLLVVLILLVGGLMASQILLNPVPLVLPPPAIHHKVPVPRAAESALTPAPAQPQPTAPTTEPNAPAPIIPPARAEAAAGPGLSARLVAMEPVASRIGALTAILNRWNAPHALESKILADADAEMFFRTAAGFTGLEVLRIDYDFGLIAKLNLPAIVGLVPGEDQATRYMAVVGLDAETIQLANGETVEAFNPAELSGIWNGVAYVFWKNHHHLDGVIPNAASGQSILALKMYLKTRGFPVAEMIPAYDAATRTAVETIQARNGLMVDGKVGPLTKIVLYNEDPSLTTPHLQNHPLG